MKFIRNFSPKTEVYLSRPRRTKEDNNNIYLKQIGRECVDWSQVAQKTLQRTARIIAYSQLLVTCPHPSQMDSVHTPVV
jgi:hypothetical protein